MDRAEAEGRDIVSRLRGGDTMESAGAATGLEPKEAGPFSRTGFVSGLGQQNKVIGTAFGLAVGEVSDVVRTTSSAIILRLLERIPADSAAWMDAKEAQRNEVDGDPAPAATSGVAPFAAGKGRDRGSQGGTPAATPGRAGRIASSSPRLLGVRGAHPSVVSLELLSSPRPVDA